METGHQLKKAGGSKRSSRHGVSKIPGISQKTLSNIESGKAQPSVVQLAKMGDIYGLDSPDLLSSKGIFKAGARDVILEPNTPKGQSFPGPPGYKLLFGQLGQSIPRI